MAIRYLGEEKGKVHAEGSSGHDDIVVLTPEHWLTIDYGKMEGLGFSILPFSRPAIYEKPLPFRK
jgi:hypothetical protein